MPTGNPALNSKVFSSIEVANKSTPMTMNGVVGKTLLSLLTVTATSLWVWSQYLINHNPSTIMPWLLIGSIGGFIVAMVTIFNKPWAPVTTLLYAALEGLALGGISAMFNDKYPGIAVQSISLTFGVLFALLLAYQSKLIKVTEGFKLGVVAATGGIAVFYVVTLLLSFFHIHVPFVFESGPIGIAFSLFVVVIAALNLVLDFSFIEQGIEEGAPNYMEWYSAFGLMVTLVWLYLEILRLLAKIRRK